MELHIIITLAVCTVAAYLVTMSSIVGPRRLIKYHVIHDVLFTAIAFFLFAGTLGGTLVSVMAGLIMAISLKLAHSYYNWALAKGYIVIPEPKAKKPRMTKADVSEAINNRIHTNVVNISDFFKKAA